MKLSSFILLEVYEFRVTNMAGVNATTYKARTIKELRVRLAIQAGVLFPCILLFKRADNTVVKDAYKIEDVFREAPKPYELSFINGKEHVVKRVVTGWSAEKWIDVAESHVYCGDEHVMQHAAPLKLADQKFDEKMDEWVEFEGAR